MRLLGSLVILCATASIAGANDRFEILDRGDAVEVIARDVKATATTIAPVRSRLEVPIAGKLEIPKLVPSGEKTIKVVELDGRSQQVLSVKLDFERPEVKLLAKHAQAIQVGNDLHVIIPRALPAAGATLVLPEPTLPPELAAKAAAIAPIPTVVEPPKAETKPAATEPAPATTTAAATTEAQIETKPETAKASTPIGKAESKSPLRNLPVLLACGLALVGCIAWQRRKAKRGGEKTVSSIEIIAQKSIGAKAKIVWLNAGGREMIVSVTQQQVRMLGQWKKSESPSASAEPRNARGSKPRMELPEATALPDRSEKQPSSPAVSGILKLRARTNVPMVNEDVATDDLDADAIWAREILAATNGARR